MKFRHHHNDYETELLGPAAIEDMARQMVLDRDVAMGNLAILGFSPDHTFEPRNPKPEPPKADAIPIRRYKHQNEFGGRLEH